MLTRLTPEATDRWLEELEVVASQVAADRVARPVDHPGSRVQVLPGGEVPAGTSFIGPIAAHRGWPRTVAKLREKAEQARLSGARWLRADVLDGLWQFTPWAQWPLPAKTQELAGATRAALGQVDWLDGVVLSSGLAVGQGQFTAESFRTDDGAMGLRRLVDPVRVREVIVIPIRPDGVDVASRWVELYGAEEGWLEWALNKVGLPSAGEVLTWRPLG